MIKAIIFDADGVLINAQMFSAQYKRDFGVSGEAMLPFFQGPMQDCLVGKADLKKELAKHVHQWQWKKSIDALLAYWFKAEHKISEPMMNEVRALKARGIICCLGTNQEKYRTEYMLKEMGFGDMFDDAHAFSSARVGHKKPDHAFFKHIVDALKLQKSEVLFWDDTAENVDAAKEFGICAELFISLDHFKDKMNKYLAL